MIEDAIETTEYCRHCLMCRHKTPMGHITSKETYTPHGFGQLVASEKRDMIEWNEEYAEVMYVSSDNGNSRAHCVTDQPLPQAIAEVRAKLVKKDIAPDEVYELRDQLKEYKTPYGESKPGDVSGSGDVALFVSDEVRYRAPEILEAALELLEAIGIDPVKIGNGRNNGFIASSLGLPGIAEDLAEANLDELDEVGADRMLVLSPGDYFAFNQMYEERLDIEWPEDVELLEVTDVLSNAVDEGTLSLDQTELGEPYAYVDPTHSVRVKSRADDPRNLLDQALSDERRELFWRSDRAFPAGNLALEFVHPDLADDLTEFRFEDATDQDVDTVVTDGAGTLHQLKQKADAFDVDVRNLYRLLADQV